MEDARELRQRALEHRVAAHDSQDLWESVIRFNLAARYDELAARREALAAHPPQTRRREVVRVG
jgi:hypothetical protein